ncbi:MAG TPA: helix-turn-helix domain-containing protein [Acidiferrobacterales bacterium]|nr:helix-turn-helix domain-containing protein [Acidiferrobacterales bacterium]
MANYKPDVFNKDCPSQKVLDRVADRWAALLICKLGEGKKRHGELQRAIGGISQKMLTQTLRNLEYDGLVSRTVFPIVPPKVEYALTPLGKTLLEVLTPICHWTERHLPELKKIWARPIKGVGV